MHAHLLRSVLTVCSGDSSDGPKVIDDVVQHAAVSRGTFYKHFRSLEEAVAELGAQLAAEMTVGIASVYDVLRDPSERTATGTQLYLRRAMFDPHWGGFIAHIGLLTSGNAMIRYMIDDIQKGIDAGHFHLATPGCGLDLVIGTNVQAFRQIVQGRRDVAYAQEMSALILRGLGQVPKDADRIASAMSQRLDAMAPGLLDWWPSPLRDTASSDGPAPDKRSHPRPCRSCTAAVDAGPAHPARRHSLTTHPRQRA